MQLPPLHPLPMHPGYSLGSIIPEDRLKYPILMQHLAHYRTEYDRAYQELLPYLDDPKNLAKPKPGDDEFELEYNCKLILVQSHKSQIEDLTKKVMQIVKASQSHVLSQFTTEENLPLDERTFQIRTLSSSFPSEITRLEVFEAKNTTDTIPTRVNTFVRALIQGRSSESVISSDIIRSVVSDLTRLAKEDISTSLVGSMITLPFVRTVDPIRLRNDYQPSEDLKEKAKDYVVLTEVVLGGFFIGIGHNLKVLSSSSEGSLDPIVLSSMKLVHFISQGAIPEIATDSDVIHMHHVYQSWKKTLQSNNMQGFPIGIKVRNLTDILRENNRIK